ncbi:amphoterin-induced protein 2-like [Notolabrus celidotus]|uniref:amphoterin-induced protein 2-like n=1 Tax=Notolabrus celidotus TaxID=1203425 RepID=UPI00148FB3B0|nr:amphoterin-induced protein 2-like [Notolabrus celidotus]
MHPTASHLSGRPDGGRRWNPASSAFLLSVCLGFPSFVATCPLYCLCASDIISCSGRNLSMSHFDLPSYATRLDLSHNALTVLPVDWISQPFDRLVTLVLSRNSISQIEVNAFVVTPRLLQLDLSLNQLTVLNTSIFTGLKELRELLLFGNQIIQINPGAFSDLYSLKRLYFSGNRLVDFPFGLYWEPGGPRNLSFLDLSNNKLSNVSVQSLLSLSQKSGIYLQENPLICDCALLAMMEYWIWKQYRPMVDFRGEYPCRDNVRPGSKCSKQIASGMPAEARTYQVEPGKWLRVPCPGFASLVQEGLEVFWVTPTTVVNSSTHDPNARLKVFHNGTIEIQRALIEDSGTYGCVAVRGRDYRPTEFPEVHVVVGNSSTTSSSGFTNRSGAEHFNTAFTTLASCVISIVLVLLYLYLTPCRCRESRGGGPRRSGARALILCSDPREVESEQRSNGKRVAFLEPQSEDLTDIGSPKPPALNIGHAATEGILKNGSRTVDQTLTDPAQMA